MTTKHTRIGHVSLYADDPHQAAKVLAGLIGGRVAPFPQHAGGWVCFLSANEFVELYPRDTQLALVGGDTHPKFVPVDGGRATGAGTHVNLIVPMSSAEIEAACAKTGKPHGWRWPGLMDVWLEERLMVELVPGR